MTWPSGGAFWPWPDDLILGYALGPDPVGDQQVPYDAGYADGYAAGGGGGGGVPTTGQIWPRGNP